jgi:hypothetical protein
MTPRLTLSLGLRYDLEVTPITATANPFFADPEKYPLDKNNFQPRFGFAYDVEGNGRGVARGGFGKFYERTYFELVGGFYNGGTYITSQNRNYPLAQVDNGPRNGQMPSHPFLVNGPFVTDAMRAAIAAEFPPGVQFQNTGATWDHPDRLVPYSYQLTGGYERQIGPNMSVSADYIHNFARDLLFTKQLNPQVRSSTVVAQSVLTRAPTPELVDAMAQLRQQNPAFVNFSTGVTIPLNIGKTDYDALQLAFEKRYSSNYSARVSYTLSKGYGNFGGDGIGSSDFQVGDDLNLELNERPTNVDRRHNLVVSWTSVIPKTGGLTVSGIGRYLSGLPFTLINNQFDEDRNGIQAEPLPAGTYRGNASSDAYEVEFDGTNGGARGPSYFKLDMRIGYRFNVRGRTLEFFGDIFNVTNKANFGTPSGNMASTNLNNFLNLTTTLQGNSNPRLLQLGARFAF